MLSCLLFSFTRLGDTMSRSSSLWGLLACLYGLIRSEEAGRHSAAQPEMTSSPDVDEVRSTSMN